MDFKIVNMYPIPGEGKLKATFTVELYDSETKCSIILREIRLYKSETGMWTAMPRYPHLERGKTVQQVPFQIVGDNLLNQITRTAQETFYRLP